MKDDTMELFPAEIVPVDSYLRQQLTIAEFTKIAKGKPEPYFVKIENCFPCRGCGWPIARLKVDRYVRLVDCYRDKSGARVVWKADVLSEHVCAGGGLQ